MVHLLGDSLEVLRSKSSVSGERGQLLALVLASITYLVLFVLHVSITGHFGSKLHRLVAGRALKWECVIYWCTCVF